MFGNDIDTTDLRDVIVSGIVVYSVSNFVSVNRYSKGWMCRYDLEYHT